MPCSQRTHGDSHLVGREHRADHDRVVVAGTVVAHVAGDQVGCRDDVVVEEQRPRTTPRPPRGCAPPPARRCPGSTPTRARGTRASAGTRRCRRSTRPTPRPPRPRARARSGRPARPASLELARRLYVGMTTLMVGTLTAPGSARRHAGGEGARRNVRRDDAAGADAAVPPDGDAGHQDRRAPIQRSPRR